MRKRMGYCRLGFSLIPCEDSQTCRMVRFAGPLDRSQRLGLQKSASFWLDGPVVNRDASSEYAKPRSLYGS
jgi:hypothetical protein